MVGCQDVIPPRTGRVGADRVPHQAASFNLKRTRMNFSERTPSQRRSDRSVILAGIHTSARQPRGWRPRGDNRQRDSRTSSAFYETFPSPSGWSSPHSQVRRRSSSACWPGPACADATEIGKSRQRLRHELNAIGAFTAQDARRKLHRLYP